MCFQLEQDDNFLLHLYLLHLSSKRKRKGSPFRDELSDRERAIRQRRINRPSLLHPSMSAFQALFGSGDDASLITLTGFDHVSFRELEKLFEPHYYSFTPYSAEKGEYLKRRTTTQKGRGRPRSLDARTCLALTLAWYRTRGAEYILQIIFGATGTPCNLWIKFGRRLLNLLLTTHPLAKVEAPTREKIDAYKKAIEEKYPLLQDVYASADGLKLYLEETGDFLIQSRYYNGWKHDHYVSNVLVFAPDGTIIFCVLNCPGCFHDSTVADWGDLYEKLNEIYEKFGGKVVVDSAFAKNRFEYLVKSAQTCPLGTRIDVLVNAQATSVRQKSEWGMRGFQGSFPRMKDRLIYEEDGERGIILSLAVRLFNLRTNLVGLNQIRSVFMPQLETIANVLCPSP